MSGDVESARLTAELKLGVALHRVSLLGGTVVVHGAEVDVVWDDDEDAS